MTKLKYWLFGVLMSVLLVIIWVAIVSFIQQEKLNEDKKENFKIEEKNIIKANTGIKLIPTFEKFSRELRSHYIYSEVMDIVAEQKWNKETKLKYCIRYKSNTDSSNYRNATLYANSSLGK